MMAADVPNTARIPIESHPLFPMRDKHRKKERGGPWSQAKERRKEVFVAKSLKERFRGKTRW